MFRLKYSLLKVISIGLISCTGTEPGISNQSLDKNKLQTLENEIFNLTQDKKCKGVNTCKAIALGVKPCGGPWKYIVYSVGQTDTTLLKQKVATYNELEKAYNQKYHPVSDCMMVLPPRLDCVNGICKPAEDFQ